MSGSAEEKILDSILDGYRREMAEDLCRLIRFPSVIKEKKAGAPFGEDIGKALEFILNLGGKWGFTTQNLEGYVGTIDYGNEEEQIGVLCHIDVVPPVKGGEHPPFGGIMEGEVIFGRGAIDNKGPMIACLYAMGAIKESGLPLKKRIRHIIGTDEETGFRCLEYFVQNYRQPQSGFVPDGYFPLTYGEKGIIHLNAGSPLPKQEGEFILSALNAGVACNVIPDKARAFIKCPNNKRQEIKARLEKYSAKSWLKTEEDGEHIIVSARGKSVHGSLPQEGINAISLLLGFIKDLPFNPELKALLNKIYTLFCEEHYGKGLNIGLKDESGPLTLAPTLLNLEGDGLEIGVDIRFPISFSLKQMEEKINASLKKAGLELRKWQAKPAFSVKRDSPLVKKLLKQYQRHTGDNSPPIAIGGGTYARVMKNFVAFGPILPGQILTAHQAEEYITLEHLLLLSKIYAGALYNLAK